MKDVNWGVADVSSMTWYKDFNFPVVSNNFSLCDHSTLTSLTPLTPEYNEIPASVVISSLFPIPQHALLRSSLFLAVAYYCTFHLFPLRIDLVIMPFPLFSMNVATWFTSFDLFFFDGISRKDCYFFHADGMFCSCPCLISSSSAYVILSYLFR